MPLRDLLATASRAANPLSKRQLDRYSRWSLFSSRKSRLRLLLVQKLIYLYFRLRNRLRARNLHHLHRLMRSGAPFMVVANHAGHADVMLHQALHSRHDNLLFTFTDSGGLQRGDIPVLPAVLYFAEVIPRHGSGQACVDRMVGRLVQGDNVLLFPEGSFDLGLVMEGFTGVARVARGYQERTGKPLTILPSCSIGMHEAYNPHAWWLSGKHHRHKRKTATKKRHASFPSYAYVDRPRQKVIVSFGSPFTLEFSSKLSKQEFVDATSEVMHRIASIWGQETIRPSHARQRVVTSNPAVDNSRVYTG